MPALDPDLAARSAVGACSCGGAGAARLARRPRRARPSLVRRARAIAISLAGALRRSAHRRRLAARDRRRCGSPRSGSTTSSARRAEPVPRRCSRRCCSRPRVLAANLREWERPRLFYFQLHARRVGRARRVLAQDLALFVVFFDLMLIPFYFLIGVWGRAGDRVAATTKLVIYTLVGSLLDARGARSRPGCSPPSRRRQHHVRALRARSDAAARTRLAGVDLPVLRRGVPGEDAAPSRCTAGCPTATARCRCRCSRSSRACSRRSARTASCAIVLPLFPDASVHFQTLMLLIALASILYGSVHGVHARPTRG